MKKTGYYGSSFDPITYGHLWSANAVMQYCNLDQVAFTPASGIRKDKHINATAEQRVEMVRLATEGNPNFTLNTYEIFEAPPYVAEETYFNLQHYKETHPDEEVWFIMGADLLPTISTWSGNSEKLIAENKFIVIERNNIIMHHVMYNDPMLRKYHDNFELVYKGLINEISSSYIRDEFKFGQEPRYLMPDSVYNYIKENGIYVGNK